MNLPIQLSQQNVTPVPTSTTTLGKTLVCRFAHKIRQQLLLHLSSAIPFSIVLYSMEMLIGQSSMANIAIGYALGSCFTALILSLAISNAMSLAIEPRLTATMLLVGLFLFFPNNPLQAEDKLKKARESLENPTAQFHSCVGKHKSGLLAMLKSAELSATKLGNIGLVTSIKSEINSFGISNRLPSTVSPLGFRTEVSSAFEDLVCRFDRQIAMLTKGRNDAEAKELSNDKDDFIAKFDEQYPRTRILRTTWTHAVGHFEWKQRNEWIEHTPNTRYGFVEIQRNREGVVLFDQARLITIALKADRSFIQHKSGPSKPLYVGKFND